MLSRIQIISLALILLILQPPTSSPNPNIKSLQNYKLPTEDYYFFAQLFYENGISYITLEMGDPG